MSLSDSDHLALLKALLERDGIRAALRYLNGLTDYRFTALYRIDGEMAHSPYFFDRENSLVEISPDAPVSGTYCVFVRDTRQAVAFADSLTEPWLEGHPKRPQLRAYCGVPLQAADGSFWGSLCHFDVVPRPSLRGLTDLMETFGLELSLRLHD